MKIEGDIHYENLKSTTEDVLRREKQEFSATCVITSETLSKLKVSIDSLPQKCQSLLKDASKLTSTQLDPITLSLRQSKELAEELQDDYEILKLKQKNKELQVKIDRNNKVIGDMRRELAEAKMSLETRNPNPDNIGDHIRQIKLKVTSYEENCDKAKAKFMKLGVPEGIYPKSLEVLVNQLEALKAEEAQLKEKADDVVFTQHMRDQFNRLRTK